MAADKNVHLRFDGAYTLSLTAAATLTSGWYCFVQADGGAVTIDPNGAETINGSATIVIPDGSSTTVWCTGSAFFATEDYLMTSPTVDVASATTTDIGAAASQNVRITGTTTITGLGTVAAGIFRRVRFAGTLTLTHNGTSLILPGAADITTAAGDVFEFISEGSGNWRCVGYTLASGRSIGSSVIPLSHFRDQKASGTAGGSASAGATAVRTLNTTVSNGISGASLSSNQVTLPAGTYDVDISTPAYNIGGGHKAWLRTSGGTILLQGSSEGLPSAGNVSNKSLIKGRITLASTTAVEVAHYTAGASASNGQGLPASSGQPEVYTDALFWKVS